MNQTFARIVVLFTVVLGTLSLCASGADRTCEENARPIHAFARVTEVAYSMHELELEDLQDIVASDEKYNPLAAHSKNVNNVFLKQKFEMALKDTSAEDWKSVRSYIANIIARGTRLSSVHDIAVEKTSPIFRIQKSAEFQHRPIKTVQVFTSANGSTYLGLLNSNNYYEIIDVATLKPIWTSLIKIFPAQAVAMHDTADGQPRIAIVHHKAHRTVEIETIDFLNSVSSVHYVPGLALGSIVNFFVLRNGEQYLEINQSANGLKLLSRQGTKFHLTDETSATHHMLLSPSGVSLVASFGKDIQIREVGDKELSSPVFKEADALANFSQFFSTPSGKIWMSYENKTETVLQEPFERSHPPLKLPRVFGNTSYHDFGDGKLWAAQVSMGKSGRTLHIYDTAFPDTPAYKYNFDQPRQKYSMGWFANELGNLFFIATNEELLVFKLNGGIDQIVRLPFKSLDRIDDVLKLFNTRDSIYLLSTVERGLLSLYRIFSPAGGTPK